MGLKDYKTTLNFIIQHPLSKNRILPSLSRYVRWQIGSRLVPGPVATKFVNDSMLLAKPGMTGATGNVYVGLHEFEDMAFLLHFLRPDDLFIDIGANIGSYTVLAGACVGADCMAFEPTPQAFAWLQRNVDLNGLADRVELRCEALGASVGEVNFTQELDCCNHLVLDGHHQEGNLLTVPMLTLDHAIDGLNPSMLKIDVEGFETEVIKGAANTLNSSNLRCVIMELDGQGTKYGFDENDIRSKFKDIGFEEFSYSPFERLLTKRIPDSRSANMLFIRGLQFVEQRLKTAEQFSVVSTFV